MDPFTKLFRQIQSNSLAGFNISTERKKLAFTSIRVLPSTVARISVTIGISEIERDVIYLSFQPTYAKYKDRTPGNHYDLVLNANRVSCYQNEKI